MESTVEENSLTLTIGKQHTLTLEMARLFYLLLALADPFTDTDRRNQPSSNISRMQPSSLSIPLTHSINLSSPT